MPREDDVGELRNWGTLRPRRMPSAAPLTAVASLAVITVLLLYFRARGSRLRCSDCDAPSKFGYSKHAESAASDIVPLCLACLSVKLGNDYEAYKSRALVIEPAANLPCYVFQSNSKWPGSKLAQETTAILANLHGRCRHCERQASFAWTTSRGLLGSNFEAVFSEGLSQTLLRWGNPEPYAVCAGCCVRQIVRTLEERDLRFLEVCGPRSEDGFVISMGY
jgi:hypothetical protein